MISVILAGGMAWGIVLVGLLIGVASIALYYVYLTANQNTGSEDDRLNYARTMVFMTLSMFQLFYVFAIRSSIDSFFTLGLWSNYRLAGAVLLGTAMQMAAIYTPIMQPFFHTVPLAPLDLAVGVGVATLAFVAVEVWKLFRRRRTHC